MSRLLGKASCHCCHSVCLPLLLRLSICQLIPLSCNPQAEGALDRNPYETSKPNEILMKLRRPEPYYAVSGGRACNQCVGWVMHAAGHCRRTVSRWWFALASSQARLQPVGQSCRA